MAVLVPKLTPRGPPPMWTSPHTQADHPRKKQPFSMATQKFSKFIRPEAGRPGQITDRDLDILEAVLRYRFCSAAHIVRLDGGNEDVTQRRSRRFSERQLINHWAFPDIRTQSEFY